MHRLTRLFLALALVMSVGGLTAGIIDFDDAVSGAAYGPVVSSDGVTVNFFAGGGSAYGAEPNLGVGGDGTTTAYENTVEGGDMRSGGGDSGFLTDEAAGPSAALDYFFTFSIGIPNLSLEVIDFRGDGGVTPGATANVFLETFSDAAGTVLIGSAFFNLGAPGVDGLVVPLSAVGGPILSARVRFEQPDIGTGIDNLQWDDVVIPEPGTVILFGTGLLALGTIVRKRRAA